MLSSYPFCGCPFHFSLYLSARSLSNFLYPIRAFTFTFRLRFFCVYGSSVVFPTATRLVYWIFYHIQWCRLSSIRLSPILRQIYLQLVLKIISHYCYSFIFGKLSFLLLLFYFHVQTNYFKTYAFKSLCTLFQNLSPFYDVSHTWLSAVVSFRAFQIPCLAIQTLILNFALLVIRFLLLHSIPQWIYLLYHLTHVFTHKSFSLPSYWNCLNLGDLITFQRVYILTYNLHYLNVRYVASCVLFSISCRLYCYASDLHSLNTHSVIIKLVCVC